ncbi:MAG: hypothetical protein KAU21_03100 [Gammaproteobacteria bacterium]|nr:hypothetical protein [Gammaproteobacteria bacterium]
MRYCAFYLRVTYTRKYGTFIAVEKSTSLAGATTGNLSTKQLTYTL